MTVMHAQIRDAYCVFRANINNKGGEKVRKHALYTASVVSLWAERIRTISLASSNVRMPNEVICGDRVMCLSLIPPQCVMVMVGTR